MPLDTFGGGVTHPSDVSFRSVVLTADLTLDWPTLSSTTDDVVARTMEVQAADDNLSIILPDASRASKGEDVLIRNIGDTAFTVKDNSGSSIASVAAGAAKYFYLTNNTSAAGSWSVIQFGSGSSSLDASLLAGLGLKAIGTTLNQSYDVIETTSDVNIASSDRAKLYVYTGGSHTVTLPTAASVGDDFFFLVKNAGAGTITITPAGDDTIDGSISLLVQPNDGVIIFSGGSSDIWYTVAQGRSVQFAFTQLVKNIGGVTADVALTSSEAQNKIITFTGTLVQSTNVIVPDTVSVYYIFNNTSGPHPLTVGTADGTGVAVTQGAREVVVCDGTDVRRGVDNTSATTLFSVGSESAPPVTFVSDTDTGIYHPAANKVGITAGARDVAHFTGVANAVNAFEFFPSETGNPIKLSAFGDDASISVLFKPKGAGKIFFEDVDFILRNSADSTKRVSFDVSAIATGTTRAIAFPDVDGTLVVLDATQTLENKTYKSAVFSGNQPKETVTGPGDVLLCPAGAVTAFAGSAAPSGWLLCDGSAISRTTYARLFAVIGTTYGAGDGATTFNLPDIQGRVIAGRDDMSGSAAGRITSAGAGIDGTLLGAAGGKQTHKLISSEMPVHKHTLTDPGHAHTIPGRNIGVQGGNLAAGEGSVLGNPSTTTNGTGISMANAGGDGEHQNTQPTIVLNYIIKA